MKKYENLDNFRKREHLVEVTIQQGEYKGKFIVPIGGNCFGLDVLEVIDEDVIYDIDKYKCIDCSIELIGEDDEDEEWFRYVLKDDEGNELEGEDFCKDFRKLIVGINIVDCKILD